MIPGGASKVVQQILEGAAEKNGYQFTLFTGTEEIDENLITSLNHCCNTVIIPSLIRKISPLRDYRAYKHLLCELRKGQFNTVHTHTSKAGFIGRLAAAKAKIPNIIHSPHGTIYTAGNNIQGVPDFSLGRRALQLSEQFAGKRTTYLTTLSENEKQICIKLGLATKENCIVIPNGINTAKFAVTSSDKLKAKKELNIRPDETALLSVGRLSPEKGHSLLLDAFSELKNTNEVKGKLKLFIVGDGPEKDRLISQAESLNLSWENGEGNGKAASDPQVIFPGHCCDIRRFLAAADLFITPSLYEGFGIVIIEAMAAGVPVVAAKTGGIPEIITDGTDGTLFPVGNSRELAFKTAEILKNPEQMKQIAEAGKIRAEYFSEQKMIQNYLNLYDA